MLFRSVSSSDDGSDFLRSSLPAFFLGPSSVGVAYPRRAAAASGVALLGAESATRASDEDEDDAAVLADAMRRESTEASMVGGVREREGYDQSSGKGVASVR